MMFGRRGLSIGFAALLIQAVLGSTQAKAQFGLAVAGVGPVNRSMGGASTAAPVDAAGALFWNPATISGLGSSEIVFGTQLLIPRTTVSSRLGAGSIGPGIPPISMSGNTGGNNGVFPLPVSALVYKPEESPWTFGIGFFDLGAFGINYPASRYPLSRTNPILSPQIPFGVGVGPLYSQYTIFQIAPTAAYQLTDQISVGLAADLDLGSLSVDPGLFYPPSVGHNSAGPAPIYPSATQGRFRLGGGFCAGVFYKPDSDWQFGASVKSPQWTDTYTFNAVTSQGQVATPKFNLDFPLIASVGTAYTGFDRLLIATDFRFLDYHDTNGFRRTGFDQRGVLRGLGWQNVFAFALGAQYLLTDSISLRAGYTFSMNPAGNAVTAFNIASPTIVQHSLSIGASYDVTKALKVSLAYVHDFQNSIEGPIQEPFIGTIPGSRVRTAATADSVILGASVSF